jgi:hypothetical protein
LEHRGGEMKMKRQGEKEEEHAPLPPPPLGPSSLGPGSSYGQEMNVAKNQKE